MSVCLEEGWGGAGVCTHTHTHMYFEVTATTKVQWLQAKVPVLSDWLLKASADN